jgi:LDH2 family malate/lactate/ureidoglycolate dehydrogenase
VRFVTADPERLRAATVALLERAGAPRDVAAVVAAVQLEADLRGMHSHGLRAIPMYLDRIALGIVNPRPALRLEGAVVHGDDGPGQYVAHRAMSLAIERARAGGIGIAVARRSNHLGAVGYYANMAADHDLIGFATTNGNVMLPPPGRSSPVVGNNPLAWAFPAGDEPPLQLDVATSVAAGGKVDLAAAEGDPVPAGWLGSDGLAIPLGAPEAPHKGFGLALALEALAGVLAGARFGRQHAGEVEDGERPWDEGHFFLAFDPGLVMPLAEFKQRMDALIRDVRDAGGRVPGEAARARRERALREGLRLPSSIYARLRERLRERAPELLPPLDEGA